MPSPTQVGIRLVERAWPRLSLLLLALTLSQAAPAAAQFTEPDPAVRALKVLSIEELMELEVTSVSKRPEKLLEAASAVQVVTGEDIRRSGSTNLPEALRLAGNLNVAAQNSHDWNISARGFNTDLANKLLVLIDGRTLYTPLFSGVFWDVQDYLLDDVDRIEIISGPGGTLWGANAVNGVINITTKSARETQGAYAEVAAGNELRTSAGVRYGGTVKPGIFFRVYGTYSDRAPGIRANGSESPNSWQMRRGGFRVDLDSLPQGSLTFQGDVYGGTENLATGGTSEVSGGNVIGRWSHTVSLDAHMTLQLYYDQTHLSQPKPAMGVAPAGILVDDLDTFDLDFQHHFRASERHRLVWGLGYRFTHNVVQSAPTVGFVPGRLDHHLFSGFVQDEVMLRENLFLTVGTKFEHNDYTNFEWEPNARLRWSTSPTQMLWAAVSRAVRTPSRIDRDLVQPTRLPSPFPSSILTGNPDFASETVVAYELGHRAQLGSNTTTSVAFFYNDYGRVRSLTPGPAGYPSFGFPLVFENNIEGRSYGTEVSATYQVSEAWRLRFAYNLLKVHLHVRPGQVDFSNALNETADPEQQFSLRSSMNLPRNIEFDAGLRWVDELHNNNGPNEGSVPSYFELDIRLAWRPTPQLELSLVGQNLLHDRHPEYGFPSPSREETERSVYGKATWRF